MQEALFEIVSSEASYLKSLNVLVFHFANSQQFSSGSSLLSSKDREVIFSNVLQVRELEASIVHTFIFLQMKDSDEIREGRKLGSWSRLGFLLINWTGVPLFPTHSRAATFDQISWSKRERAARFRSFFGLFTQISFHLPLCTDTVGRIIKQNKDNQTILSRKLGKPCGFVNLTLDI